ncbi:helix-turn-helix domain-containing protein [Neobacillus niacini]|uniref:helix-turn-helix domain-containing protein n=1 Tax=Neobacillus niacini TaxID=86668 RepID=UPI0033413701
MTFIKFLTTERIKRSEFLLSDQKANVIDIAYDSGFSSKSWFYTFYYQKDCSGKQYVIL